MTTRFVILHHQAPAGEHWDLMLEQGDGLLTWQLLQEPVDGSRLPITARQIGLHRKVYLDYEGPIRGGRGRVRRIDAGTVRFEQSTPHRYVIMLDGSRLSGRFVLADTGKGWILSRNLPPS